MTVTKPDPEKERKRLAELYAGMSDGELRKFAAEAGSLSDAARGALRAEVAGRHLDIYVAQPRTGPDTSQAPRLVTLRAFRDVPEALLAKGVLDSAGIESFIDDDNVVRMAWHYSNAIGGVKLRVREEDTAGAAALLDQQPPDTFNVEGVGEYKQPRCSSCGSKGVSLIEFPQQWGWKCDACGHSWEGSNEPPESAP